MPKTSRTVKRERVNYSAKRDRSQVIRQETRKSTNRQLSAQAGTMKRKKKGK